MYFWRKAKRELYTLCVLMYVTHVQTLHIFFSTLLQSNLHKVNYFMLWMVLLLEVYFRYFVAKSKKSSCWRLFFSVKRSKKKLVNETVCVVMFVFQSQRESRYYTVYFINQPTLSENVCRVKKVTQSFLLLLYWLNISMSNVLMII